jgi:hypothetical protein
MMALATSQNPYACRYVYLLDREAKVRWQGSGTASEEELQTLYHCAEALLRDEKS